MARNSHTSHSELLCTVNDLAEQLRIKQNEGTTAVCFDETTHEPYIPFPESFPIHGLRLTPARGSDVHRLKEILDHPLVYPNLFGPPYPLPLNNAEGWVRGSQEVSNEVFAAWASGDFSRTASSPFNTVRHIGGGADGADVFVGEIALGETRDHKGLFDSGVCLDPSYHGKGVASTAIKLLLNLWAIPNMTCNEIIAESFKSNPASRRVYENAGFVVNEKRSGEIRVQPENKRVEGRSGAEEEVVVVWHRTPVII
ncbi:hypothetical protein FIBSPDRAFT_1052924 [Athelia psychrophila]|uniref:N-acetyltransferase domain-containing protein n=1 Tax=Athelia psychrophila TaxID=1759441 RepID=A0A167XS70_9AGAM|nr:hypothetical protein FIBSPDRAFT_1052924 [Fibularhizoctonia sp. CBS 109695]